jgi:hypothetical protein
MEFFLYTPYDDFEWMRSLSHNDRRGALAFVAGKYFCWAIKQWSTMLIIFQVRGRIWGNMSPHIKRAQKTEGKPQVTRKEMSNKNRQKDNYE